MTQNIQSITIGIAVHDVNEATGWYQSLLGDVETMEPAPGVVELQLSANTWLQLDDSGDLKVGGSILRLETHDINAAYNNVKQLQPEVGAIEVVEGVISYFDFVDLAGNRLSYYQLVAEEQT